MKFCVQKQNRYRLGPTGEYRETYSDIYLSESLNSLTIFHLITCLKNVQKDAGMNRGNTWRQIMIHHCVTNQVLTLNTQDVFLTKGRRNGVGNGINFLI